MVPRRDFVFIFLGFRDGVQKERPERACFKDRSPKSATFSVAIRSPGVSNPAAPPSRRLKSGESVQGDRGRDRDVERVDTG